MNNGNNMEIENTTYQEIDFAPKIGINWSPTDESGVVIFTMQKAVVVGGALKHLLPPANDIAVTLADLEARDVTVDGSVVPFATIKGYIKQLLRDLLTEQAAANASTEPAE